MTAFSFFTEMARLREAGEWDALEHLLEEDHPTLPGEREAYLELVGQDYGQQLQLDSTGLHVVSK